MARQKTYTVIFKKNGSCKDRDSKGRRVNNGSSRNGSQRMVLRMDKKTTNVTSDMK